MAPRTNSHPSLDGLIRDLYGSLSEEVHFENPLHRLGSAFRSHLSTLHTEDFGAHRGRLAIAGDLSEGDFLDFREAYASRWSGENLWMERSLEGFRKQGYQHGEAVVGDQELLASPYYQHALKPMDLRYGLGIQLCSDDKLNLTVAAFHRGHGERGFDADDFALIRQVRPHMVNAYAIYRRLAKLEDSNASLRTCLERAPLGMIVLDANGLVLESNAAAEQWLQLAGIVRTRNGHLGFAAARMQQRYTEALKTLAGSQAAPSQSICLEAVQPGVQFGRGLVLHLCAVPLGVLSGARPGARILAFVAELQPAHVDVLAERVLRQAFGFSPAEARVALALRRESDVTAAAKTLNLRPSTVRAHLRSLHARLRISRTTELLLLMERLVGSAPTGM
jgi:DNA-binding CsgD family transcriptional regulator/PAS domain-containing protein